LALLLLAAPTPSTRYSQQNQQAPKLRTDWAHQRLRLLARWLAQRDQVVVCASCVVWRDWNKKI